MNKNPNDDILAELTRQVEEHGQGKVEQIETRRSRVDREVAEAMEMRHEEALASKRAAHKAVMAEFGDQVEQPFSFEEYQAGAKQTAIYNRDARVLYPALGLVGEVGEVIEKCMGMAAHAGKAANQVKKIIRDDDCECDTPRKHGIGKEIGGVLWYCAAVCSDLGLDLAAIARENLGVLADRQERGTLKGDGDNR